VCGTGGRGFEPHRSPHFLAALDVSPLRSTGESRGMMTAFWTEPDFDDHELVEVIRDRASGLTAIIAIHSTHLGPAGGGARFWHYAEPADAMRDALRLSRGMSYKNAMAGLPAGGGKAVIL